MSLAQQLLVRSLVSRFWRKPYTQSLVPWGTDIHDRWMLPHFVWDDFCDVIEDLRRDGYPMKSEWFEPHFEFRFPQYGDLDARNVHLEIRHALEPWHVLGEEPGPGGTVRYVDSSLERVQIKASGLTDTRHVITAGGWALPLHPTGVNGEFVCGLRYRAWQPPNCLHPTIEVHTPLVFDVVDTWNGRSIGGCTYHVMHPGGLSYATFPINALRGGEPAVGTILSARPHRRRDQAAAGAAEPGISIHAGYANSWFRLPTQLTGNGIWLDSMETVRQKSGRVVKIIARLKQAWPDARLALDFSNPLELLIALILAAQARDDRVNVVTAELFKKYRTAAEWADVPELTLQKEISQITFFRNKTRSIKGACRMLVEKFGGVVPDNLEDLLTLPGVGPKTANVLLGNAFGRATVGVDRHVARVSGRLELTKQTDPDLIEADLMKIVPEPDRVKFCHLLQHHGRRICIAKSPKCPECVINSLCPFRDNKING